MMLQTPKVACKDRSLDIPPRHQTHTPTNEGDMWIIIVHIVIHLNQDHLTLVAGEDGLGSTGTILLSIDLKEHHTDPHIKVPITIRPVTLAHLSVGIIIEAAIKTVDLQTMAHSLTANQLRIVVEDTLVIFNGLRRDRGTVGVITIPLGLIISLIRAHHRLSIN
jgi:hypothetical protein